jgi:hypothetical protein
MAAHRSSIKGAASFRRLLKRLPDSADARLVAVLQQAGPILAERMKERLPYRTGHLQQAISWRVTPNTKNLKVGLLSKAGNRKLFYGHIIDIGRRDRIVRATRHNKSGSVSTYLLHVKAKAGIFLESAGLRDFRNDVLPDFRKLMDSILLDAARGAGND